MHLVLLLEFKTHTDTEGQCTKTQFFKKKRHSLQKEFKNTDLKPTAIQQNPTIPNQTEYNLDGVGSCVRSQGQGTEWTSEDQQVTQAHTQPQTDI